MTVVGRTENRIDHPDVPVVTRPEFAVSWRGYLRTEVDSYVKELTGTFNELVDRYEHVLDLVRQEKLRLQVEVATLRRALAAPPMSAERLAGYLRQVLPAPKITRATAPDAKAPIDGGADVVPASSLSATAQDPGGVSSTGSAASGEPVEVAAASAEAAAAPADGPAPSSPTNAGANPRTARSGRGGRTNAMT